MNLLLEAADLVICRSGGNTVAELAVTGRPAVLVPYPWASGDHQTVNATELEDAGAAVVLADGEVSTERLDAIITGLRSHPGRLSLMSAAARSVARPDAAAQVADLIETAVAGRSGLGYRRQFVPEHVLEEAVPAEQSG